MGSGQNWFVDKWVKLCRRSECRQVRHSYLWFYGDLCAHCNSLVLLSGCRQLPNGVCWCLVPTQLIQIIETGNNKIKKSLFCFLFFFNYVCCLCRPEQVQGSPISRKYVYDVHCLCRLVPLHYMFAGSLVHQSPVLLYVVCFLAYSSLWGAAGLLWALLVRKSDYSNANADLVRHQLRTANLPVPAGTGSTSCLKICAQSPYWV